MQFIVTRILYEMSAADLTIFVGKQPWGRIIETHLLSSDNKCCGPVFYIEFGISAAKRYYLAFVESRDGKWIPISNKFYLDSLVYAGDRPTVTFTDDKGNVMVVHHLISGFRFFQVRNYGETFTLHSHPVSGQISSPQTE